jgi:hypothetical protein
MVFNGYLKGKINYLNLNVKQRPNLDPCSGRPKGQAPKKGKKPVHNSHFNELFVLS